MRNGRGLFSWIALVSLLAVQPASAQTTTWYVGPNGSDSSTCGTSSAPCRTVNYTLSKVAAGHTIRMLPGTYTNQGTIRFNASNHRNVTLTAADTSNRPLISDSQIAIAKVASGVTISHLRVQGNPTPTDGYWGVIEVSSYPAVIENNEITNGGQGVMIRTSQQVTVRNNHIYNLGLPDTDSDTMCVLVVNWNNDPVPSGFGSAIRITGNTLHDCGGDGIHENSWSEAGVQFNFLIIDNNAIYNNQEQGIDTKGTDDLRVYSNDIHGNGAGGISNNSVYGSTSRWEIYNNRIHDHINFAIFNQGGGSAWKVWNNQIYRNVQNPWYNYCAVTLPLDSATEFYGNTLVNNYDTSGSMQTCAIFDGNTSNVKNNIFYNNGIGSNDYGHIRSAASGTPSYNYFYPVSGKMGTNYRTTCVTSGNCPGFTNLGGANFNLTSNSPAIDGGTALASQYTLDASGRSRSGAWDLGAFEYGGGSTTTPAPAAPSNVRILR